MRGHLFKKYMTIFTVVAFVSFLMIATFGANMIQKNLMNETGQRLYAEANEISAEMATTRIYNQTKLLEYESILSSVAKFEDAQIWYLNARGEILLDTKKGVKNTLDRTVIKGFDPLSLGKGIYTTGRFFSYFNQDMLSVLVPISSTTNAGYIAIHTPVVNIFEMRDHLLLTVYRLFALILLFCFFVLLYFVIYITKPLREILDGVKEYAAGNLTYEIPVISNDEFGTLSSTLNYMSDEMNKSVESQKAFISNVSHDFRSPLTSIKGYVSAILDGTIPTEQQDKYLKIVLNESKRLETLTQGILTLNHVNQTGFQLNYSHFDINDVIRETAALFEGACRKRYIVLELVLFESELFVYADYRKIQQVLYNLLDNAIKFSKDHSEIRIETTARRTKVSISVKDHGIGIPAANLPKIWERFYKIDTSRGKDASGTGLGLAIVKELVNAHKQIITVVSTEGAGTEFSFTLERGRNPDLGGSVNIAEPPGTDS